MTYKIQLLNFERQNKLNCYFCLSLFLKQIKQFPYEEYVKQQKHIAFPFGYNFFLSDEEKQKGCYQHHWKAKSKDA